MNGVRLVVAASVLALVAACGGGSGGSGSGSGTKIQGTYCSNSFRSGTYKAEFTKKGDFHLNDRTDWKYTVSGTTITTTENGDDRWHFDFDKENDVLTSNTIAVDMKFDKDTCKTPEFKEAYATQLEEMKVREAEQKEQQKAAEAAAEAARIEAAKPPPPLVVPASWWPKDWDKTLVTEGNSFIHETDAKKVQAMRQRMVSSQGLRLFLLAHTPEYGPEFQPVWVWYSAIKSCTGAQKIIDDLTTEFGDTARAATALQAAHDDFTAWAAGQPKELTISGYAKLGAWMEADESFQYDSGFTMWMTDPDQAAFTQNYGIGVYTYTPQNAPSQLASINVPFQNVWCPSEDGKSAVEYNPGVQWDLKFGELHPVAVSGPNPGFVNYPELPLVKMTRDEARQFAETQPDRLVKMSITFTASDKRWRNSPSTVHGLLKTIKVTSVDGKPLAEKAY